MCLSSLPVPVRSIILASGPLKEKAKEFHRAQIQDETSSYAQTEAQKGSTGAD